MLDPDAFDGDLAKTQADANATRVDQLELTEIDPFATALPLVADQASVVAEPLVETVDDPYATRATEPTLGPGNTLGSTTTEQGRQGHGQGPSMGGGLRSSRYRPLRLHARGGLGEIFVAVDGELNREVALKEIQERHGGHDESQLRFVFEAEITGGLEHPGIVPVYGLGRYSDGRPYYAMRFIRGESLKAAIQKYHEASKAKAPSSGSTLRHSLEFHQLLARFVAVCHAIDYAHSRGVLHRDIKPTTS